MVPPINVVSVAQTFQAMGRYEIVNTRTYITEWCDTEADLRSWLSYSAFGPILIDCAVAQVKSTGLCTLCFKGITIRDTQWVKPLSTIDWSMFKQASNECR